MTTEQKIRLGLAIAAFGITITIVSQAITLYCLLSHRCP